MDKDQYENESKTDPRFQGELSNENKGLIKAIDEVLSEFKPGDLLQERLFVEALLVRIAQMKNLTMEKGAPEFIIATTSTLSGNGHGSSVLNHISTPAYIRIVATLIESLPHTLMERQSLPKQLAIPICIELIKAACSDWEGVAVVSPDDMEELLGAIAGACDSGAKDTNTDNTKNMYQ